MSAANTKFIHLKSNDDVDLTARETIGCLRNLGRFAFRLYITTDLHSDIKPSDGRALVYFCLVERSKSSITIYSNTGHYITIPITIVCHLFRSQCICLNKRNKPSGFDSTVKCFSGSVSDGYFLDKPSNGPAGSQWQAVLNCRFQGTHTWNQGWKSCSPPLDQAGR
jgi:hypothetical protein